MGIDEKVFKFPKNFCWETNGQVAELIKQAEGALQYLEENSVGYYYYWMLEELKKYAVKAPSTPPALTEEQEREVLRVVATALKVNRAVADDAVQALRVAGYTISFTGKP